GRGGRAARVLPQQPRARPPRPRRDPGRLMRFDIRYRTTFTYDNLVRESQNELRACPATDDAQQLIAYRVHTSPSSRVLSFSDYWGTRVDAFGVRSPHLSLEVSAEASVETRLRPLVTAAPRDDALRDPAFIEEHL